MCPLSLKLQCVFSLVLLLLGILFTKTPVCVLMTKRMAVVCVFSYCYCYWGRGVVKMGVIRLQWSGKFGTTKGCSRGQAIVAVVGVRL